MPILKTIKGDITKTDLKYIAHGVNCQGAMGSGVAKALYSKFPNVRKAYMDYCRGARSVSEPRDLLGFVVRANCGDKDIFNCFTQEQYGYNGCKYVDYEAIHECFTKLNDILKVEDHIEPKIAIPRIGCGLAGGNWDVVKILIDDAAPDIDVYVYEI